MTVEKIYVIATADIDRLNALCQAGNYASWRGVWEGPVFIGVLEPGWADFDARDRIAALPGFTVLPSHNDPAPLPAPIVAALAQQGIALGDTMWAAAIKLFTKYAGAGGTPHALRPDR